MRPTSALKVSCVAWLLVSISCCPLLAQHRLLMFPGDMSAPRESPRKIVPCTAAPLTLKNDGNSSCAAGKAATW